MTTKLLLFGANNPHVVRMIRDVEKSQDIAVIGFADNDPAKAGTEFCGRPVWSTQDAIDGLDRDTLFVNLITRDCQTRHATTQVLLTAGFAMGRFVHPSVELRDVNVGLGVYIQEGVRLQADVTLEENCSISAGSTVTHECHIGAHSFIASGVTISGIVTIGPGCFLGAGVTTVPRVSIGEGCVIGAGAVVVKDIPAWSVAVGNPARVIKKIEPVSYT